MSDEKEVKVQQAGAPAAGDKKDIEVNQLDDYEADGDDNKIEEKPLTEEEKVIAFRRA